MGGLRLPPSLLLVVLFGAAAIAEVERSVYVVYMGATPPAASPGSLEQEHLQLVASVVTRNAGAQQALVRSYRHGFSGFAARLSREEALAVGKRPGVVSVFADPVLQLHTTRSWDFLRLQNSVETDSTPLSGSASSAPGGAATDTIIGMLDTGIWPESESFDDKGMGEVPARWKGRCVEAHDFNVSNCNRKLIGARSYEEKAAKPSAIRPAQQEQSPRDAVGHGTHTASTAAGSPVLGASYYGLAAGTAQGGSASSRLAVYKVCTSEGCRGSAILAAFDDAIADGVDVLSLSLGASAYFRPDFSSDPIAIGAFHAVDKGIVVVCSAGNDGPDPATVVNAAPWILTVAATTIDRDFESDVVLGGGGANNNSSSAAIKGEAINFSNLGNSPIHPLISGFSARANRTTSEASARNCEPDALDGNKIKGKVVLCEHPNGSSKREKMDALKSYGAVGMILVNDREKAVASSYVSFPATLVSSKGAEDIRRYINSTKDPVATIVPTITVTKYKPAPAVAYFSSRGPSAETRNILKPDVAAPGVNILAAWPPEKDPSKVPPGQKPSAFNLISGTSMSCPHVSGVAAAVKSRNPSWGPSAIRSAIVTTATQTNNAKAALTLDSGPAATPYDYGAGEVSPAAALRPGLVYEAGTQDYLLFLCNYGYEAAQIKLVARSLPEGFECPKNGSADAISDLNYPSIAVSGFDGKGSRAVSRALTNVGEDEEAEYVASVESPKELVVQVAPEKLQFTKGNKKVGYRVTFSSAAASSSSSSPLQGDFFGSITWSNGNYRVRSPFVVSTWKR